MSDTNLQPFPHPEPRDRIRQVVQAIVDAPPGGSSANRVLDLILAPKVVKRREAWLERLGQKVVDLLRRADDIEGRLADLMDSDRFATVALHASTIADRTHDHDKLEMLADACLRVVLPGSADEQYDLIFLRLLDQMSALHCQVLAFLADRPGWMSMHGLKPVPPGSVGVSAERYFATAIPVLAGERELANLIVRDLEGYQLVWQLPENRSLVVWERALATQATELGLLFLGFIDPPWPPN